MTILVIGSGGQLAASLAAASSRFPSINLTFLGRPEIDLAEGGTTAAAIKKAKPTLIINCAAYTQVDKAEREKDACFQINRNGAGEIATAAAQIGAGVLHISTDYVFDGRSATAYDENAVTNPLNVYGRSKLAGEEAVREATPDHIIIRTSWLVSQFGQNFVKTMLRLAAERDTIAVVADQVGLPTIATDLADSLLSLAVRWPEAQPGTYHVASGGEPASWADLAETVMAARRFILGDAPTIRRIPTDQNPGLAERPQRSVLDCGKAHRVLAIVLPDWQTGIQNLIHQLHERGHTA